MTTTSEPAFSTSDRGASSTGWTWAGPTATATTTGSTTATTSWPTATHSNWGASSSSPISNTITSPSGAGATPTSLAYGMTTWTMWVEVNGSTSPAVVRVASVGTVVPITYAVEGGTLVPLESLSSTGSASPSPTAAAIQDKQAPDNRKIIAGVVAGTVVGLTLGIILVWLIGYKRRGARSRDYLAQGSRSWGGSREGGLLDLDGGARETDVGRETVVVPWAMPVSFTREKDVGGRTGLYPGSDVGASAGRSEGEEGSLAFVPSLQPDSDLAKSRWILQSYLHPRSQPQRESHSRSWPRRAEQVPSHNVSLANPVLSTLYIRSQGAIPTQTLRDLQRAEDAERYNAIPPSYNEVWKTTQ